MRPLQSRLHLLAAAATLALPTWHAHAADAANGDGAPPLLTPIAEVRLRSESVTQSGMPKDAEALTLRGRLGFETAARRATSLLVEGELVWPLATHYNSTVNGKTEYPIVADPEAHEINRLQLTSTAIAGTRITIGRQRIALDDQRFVGNSGWRQNEQTFDALRVINTSVRQLTLDLTYLDQVNRVNGPESPVGRFHGDSYLASAAYKLPAGTLTAFANMLEFDEAATDSSSTVGLRFNGSRALGPGKLGFLASYATQHERANNPLDYEADFHALALTGAYREWSLEVGFEQLTGDGVKGFSTPLATLHRFQGWADKFLTTPPNGIDDRYVTAGYAKAHLLGLERLSATASYHAFDAERGAGDYGSEIDLQARAEWKRLRVGLKFADYAADGFATDTTKYWVDVEYVW